MVRLWEYGNENGLTGAAGEGWTGIWPRTYPGGATVETAPEYPVEGAYSLRITQDVIYDWGGPYRIIDPVNLTQYRRLNFRSYIRIISEHPSYMYITTVPMDAAGNPLPYTAGGVHHDLLEVRATPTGVMMRPWLNDLAGYPTLNIPYSKSPGTYVCFELEYDADAGVGRLYIDGEFAGSLVLPTGWTITPGGLPPGAGRVSHVQGGVTVAPPVPIVKHFDAHVVADEYIGPLTPPVVTAILTFQSMPIPVTATVNGVDVPSGSQIEVPQGDNIITVPSEVIQTVRYIFDRWEDGSTNPTRTLNVTGDLVITAYYVIARHLVTFQSVPIPVQADINGTPIVSGQSVQVDDGTMITASAPPEVEV